MLLVDIAENVYFIQIDQREIIWHDVKIALSRFRVFPRCDSGLSSLARAVSNAKHFGRAP
jgi:hypothetical protein